MVQKHTIKENTRSTLICSGMNTNQLSFLAEILSQAKIPLSVSAFCHSSPSTQSFSVDSSKNGIARFASRCSTSNIQSLGSSKSAVSNKNDRVNLNIDDIVIDESVTNAINASNNSSEETAFLFVVEHWSCYLQNYYRSLAEIIANELPTGKVLKEAIEAWLPPSMVSEAWLTYHRSLLEQFHSQPERCFFILATELDDAHHISSKLYTLLDLNLPSLSAQSNEIDQKYSIDNFLIENIPDKLKNQLDELYAEIHQLTSQRIDKSTVYNLEAGYASEKAATDKVATNPLTPPSFSLNTTRSEGECRSTQLVLDRKAEDIEDNLSAQAINTFDYPTTISKLKDIQKYGFGQKPLLVEGLVNNLLKLQPENWRTYEWLGRLCTLNNEFDKAETFYFKAISNEKSPPYLYQLIAELFLQQGQLIVAKKYYKKAIEKNPKNGSFYFGLALHCKKLRDYEGALDNFQQILSLNPNHLDAQLQIIDCLVYLDRIVESRQHALVLWQKRAHLAAGDFISRIDRLNDEANLDFETEVNDRFLQRLPVWLSELPTVTMQEDLRGYFLDSLHTVWHRQGFTAVGSGDNPGYRLHPALPAVDISFVRPISFIVIRFSDEMEHNFKRSNAITAYGNQIVEVDNTANLFHENLSRAIIHGIAQAQHEVIAVIHEDVLLVDHWQMHFERSLRELEQYDDNWGMVGAVGWKENGQIFGHWSDPHYYRNSFVAGGKNFSKVVKLDEQLLIFNKNRLPDFDPALPGIHHIGSDLRMTLLEMGFATYALNAPTIHKYADHNGDLVFSRKDSVKIQDRQSRTYLADKAVCDDYIRHKWLHESIPHCGPYAPVSEPDISAVKRQQLESPIILLSRGGSGSRLCSLLAQDAGIFLGNDVAGTGDSLEFVSAIYQGMVAKFRCFTDRQQAQIVPRLRQTAAEVLKDVPENMTWGFKLPESVFLLPELRQAFPNARYIHFLRDPKTTTLRRTHMTARLDNHIGRISLALAYDYLHFERKHILSDSPALHMAYTTIHQLSCIYEHLTMIDDNDFIEVRYEDVLHAPQQQVENLCQWLGVTQQTDTLESAIDIKRSQTPKTVYDEETVVKTLTALEGIRRTFAYV